MIATTWNYDINAESMPSILTKDEFNEMTANKYLLDSRVDYIIKAVSSSIRNYVGWHIGGNVECQVQYTFDDLHINRFGRDIIIQLPTRHMTAIKGIYINDIENTMTYRFKRNGTLTIYNALDHFNRYDILKIVFMSGLDDDPGLKSLVASRTSNVLAGVGGVSSESAGGVSISYSAAYVAGSNASTLLTSDKDYLNYYRIVEIL